MLLLGSQRAHLSPARGVANPPPPGVPGGLGAPRPRAAEGPASRWGRVGTPDGCLRLPKPISVFSAPPPPFSLQQRLTMWKRPSLKKTRVWR